MNFPQNPPLNRVPGVIAKPKEYALDKDLTKLSKREILDLKSRQEKLLENKGRLNKLPDKGKKIKDLYDRVLAALELKNEIEMTSNLLSSLKLNTNDLNNMEWRDKKIISKDILDSDDDEDPLAIMASSNSVNNNQKIIKNSKESDADKPLITEEDLKEADEIRNSELVFDPVLNYVCRKENIDPPSRFLPYKPKPKTFDSSSTSLEAESKKTVRDNTAATPPVIKCGVKSLTIRESLEIEDQHRQKMKELKEQQAAERLAIKIKELGVQSNESIVNTKKLVVSDMHKYRLASSIIDDIESDENEEKFSDQDEDDDGNQ
ncbi:CLUMA_CG018047, isoform A [Clunio marinus]|uniref:CLUMA_CG018047, isoform A n=1 Tax=Clunio marinus TaxID=568069 RepID=A0A1J1IYF3_9DIPT|nr:CLUMA_CG018047, isoform A [Clunio marinus]